MLSDPTTSSTKDDLRTEIQELRGLADELRLQIHLAGMEARQAWRHLEPRIEAAQRVAQDELQALGDEVAGDVRDAIEIVKRMAVDLRRRLGSCRSSR